MLFNSFEFFLVFLPISLLGYFGLCHFRMHTIAKIWLIATSLFFYGWWNPKHLYIIGGSIIFNFVISYYLIHLKKAETRKLLLIAGIVANCLLLFYYKYVDFFLDNINYLTSSQISLLHIAFPLGISFFTFQQIAFLVDSHKNEVPGYSFIDYSLFVSFFPHLTAGPIDHHKKLIPQFQDDKSRFDSFNFSKGLYIFFMGLVKKVVVADSFAVLANSGFGNVENLGFMDSWITSISYSIQLYFDFSGYSDMALGIALLFNISIAINFDSPYKAVSIQDFWRRWHITLSTFLRNYIYIPLGGNRGGEFGTIVNLFLTFLIGGIWHGAAWTFIIWGAMHGFATGVHRVWTKSGKSMPDWAGMLVTLLYVNFAWVFFRAKTFGDAMHVVKGMLGFKGFSFSSSSVLTDIYLVPMLGIGLVLLFLPNPPQLAEKFTTNAKHIAYIVILAVIGLLFMNSITANDFLYFDF